MNKDILYQKETQKALLNFPFSYHPVQLPLLYKIVVIKSAAAEANAYDGGISSEMSSAIIAACSDILKQKHDEQFVTCALQGGAGTSLHSNVNEVIATLATNSMHDSHQIVHPLDHVNKSQSTNDVLPSALRMFCYESLVTIHKSLKQLITVCKQKAEEGRNIPKLARTHLQDAVATTVGDEWSAYAAVFEKHISRLNTCAHVFLVLPLGGTAIGNGINASDMYREHIYKALAQRTGYTFIPAENKASFISSQTDFVYAAHTITELYCDLSKIASDIRLLASGPLGGLGEIILPDLQNGSTIMPGKVNPVLFEAVNQAYFLFYGLSATIEQACHAAQLELGVMFPILSDALITMGKIGPEVIDCMTNAVSQLTFNNKKCGELLNRSTANSTLLTPQYGHEKVSELVKKAVKKHISFEDVVNELED